MRTHYCKNSYDGAQVFCVCGFFNRCLSCGRHWNGNVHADWGKCLFAAGCLRLPQRGEWVVIPAPIDP